MSLSSLESCTVYAAHLELRYAAHSAAAPEHINTLVRQAQELRVALPVASNGSLNKTGTQRFTVNWKPFLRS
jgi:hypothetical protein